LPVDWRAQRDRALRGLETEKQPSARIAAARELRDLASERHGPPADFGPVLLRLLGDPETEVRRLGLEVAGAILPFEEVEPLLRARASDPSPAIRLTAVGLIADLERPECRPLLATALEDEAFTVRFEAARGLAALRHGAGLQLLIEALEYPDLRFRALGALAELGDAAAVPAIRKTFRRWLLPGFDKTQAAGVLVKLGETEVAEYLLQRTYSRFSTDRAFAIELCGEVKVRGAFERLLEILRDSKDPARGAAARGLGRLENPDALGPLAALLADSSISEDLRLDVAEALCLLRVPAARQKVEEALVASQQLNTRRALQEVLEAYR
jgi:HEAT repeat protein